ncbi:hypothetical protein Vadar_009610 [Vaccinium darrowii]|uniref:Uncharacterized protein n=1 Tax=Vaccinium darrowii TaxID=229202 RepID=A0ACB7ZA34_9ERIC|nr:hypothetical protein Vadar_009610 [Vaccinium darrowii]
MEGFQLIDPVGIAGGLVVYWKKELKVRLVRKCSFFIDLLISDDEAGCEWHLINLYASTNDTVRKAQWGELLHYRQRSSGEWIIWGDFNDLLWDDEKQGSRRREAWSLRAFRQFTTELGAIDMGFSGYPFTWVNRRYGDGLIKERLDRVLVSLNWKLQYDKAVVRHLATVGSDHAALLLDTDPPMVYGHRQFRFDSSVKTRIAMRWSDKVGRVLQGDRKCLRRRNRITGIQKADGTWCEEPEGIAQEFVNYFQSIFQSEGTASIEEVLNAIQEG